MATGSLPLRDLPMEIHGHILALQHDKKTLLASSQVSRIWRELVLPWLFFSFRVYVRSFSRLEDFIASVPHLAKYVQVVFVDGVHSNRPFHNAPAFLLAHDSPPLCTLLALPSLKELHCQFVCFETAQITVGASGVATVPHRLRRLVLDRCWARDWTSASSFLSICASLAADTLEISEPRLVQSAISRPQPSLSPFIACRTLVVKPLEDSRAHYLMLDALSQSLVPRSLQTLTVDCWDWTHVTALNALLRNAGADLRHFDLSTFNMAIQGDEGELASEPPIRTPPTHVVTVRHSEQHGSLPGGHMPTTSVPQLRPPLRELFRDISGPMVQRDTFIHPLPSTTDSAEHRDQTHADGRGASFRSR